MFGDLSFVIKVSHDCCAGQLWWPHSSTSDTIASAANGQGAVRERKTWNQHQNSHNLPSSDWRPLRHQTVLRRKFLRRPSPNLSLLSGLDCLERWPSGPLCHLVSNKEKLRSNFKPLLERHGTFPSGKEVSWGDWPNTSLRRPCGGAASTGSPLQPRGEYTDVTWISGLTSSQHYFSSPVTSQYLQQQRILPGFVLIKKRQREVLVVTEEYSPVARWLSQEKPGQDISAVLDTLFIINKQTFYS